MISLCRRVTRTVIALPIAALALSACVSGPAPSSVSCDGIVAKFNSPVVEQCHNRYRPYKMDVSSSAAQQKANSLASSLTSCANLSNYHTAGGTLLALYGGATSVGENLYCYGSGAGCPSATFGATKAMNGWLSSTGHKANLDRFAGAWVNAGAACGGSGLYFAVAQFHAP